MAQIFITIVNMSVTASVVALVVMLARLALKKSPKIFSYILWAAMLFRMLSPVAPESNFGFSRPVPLPLLLPQALADINISPEVVTLYPVDYVADNLPVFLPETTSSIGGAQGGADEAMRQKDKEDSQVIAEQSLSIGTGSMLTFINIAAFIWLLGIIVLFVYAVFSYNRIKRRIFAVVLVRDNIYESDRITSPFVIGFIRPRIIIPTGLNTDEAEHVIQHEQTHIRRCDHYIKLLAFMGLALHWFNPLMWVSYFLMAKDMELSCDESVMRKAKTDIRTDYSNSLLNMSVRQSGLPNPLSFGESNIKFRVNNVLNFKKCSRFVILLSTVFTFVVVGVCVVNGASPTSNGLMLNLYFNEITVIDGDIFRMRVNESERHTAENLLSGFLSGFNLEHHHEGRFYPSENRIIRNLQRENTTDIITVVYMRPRPTWHNITSFIRLDTAPGEVSPQMDILLKNIPQGVNNGTPWLIANYRADTWEIHVLYSFSGGEYHIEKIVTWPQLFHAE